MPSSNYDTTPRKYVSRSFPLFSFRPHGRVQKTFLERKLRFSCTQFGLRQTHWTNLSVCIEELVMMCSNRWLKPDVTSWQRSAFPRCLTILESFSTDGFDSRTSTGSHYFGTAFNAHALTRLTLKSWTWEKDVFSSCRSLRQYIIPKEFPVGVRESKTSVLSSLLFRNKGVPTVRRLVLPKTQHWFTLNLTLRCRSQNISTGCGQSLGSRGIPANTQQVTWNDTAHFPAQHWVHALSSSPLAPEFRQYRHFCNANTEVDRKLNLDIRRR